MKKRIMKTMNSELKKVVSRVKVVQTQLQDLLKSKTWVEEARKYAEKRSKEVTKLFTSDANRVKAFVERERKELERIQKQIPSEVKKFKKFVDGQKKEFEKLLVTLRKNGGGKPAKKKSRGTKKKSGAKKSTKTASSSAHA